MHRLPTPTPSRLVTRARAALATLAVAALVAACAKGSEGAADSAGAAPEGAPAAASSSGGSRGSVHLEVVGGKNAGTYDVQMPDGGCSYGLAGDKAWGNQYSIDTSDTKAFSSLQLVVPDAKAAASGTSTFHITAGFGPLFGQGNTEYDVNTLPDASKKSGSGTVKVEDNGSTGKVTFDAKTADGVQLKGTIDCAAVTRAG